MPEAIRVANWREKMARARRLTLLNRWKMLSSFIASRFSETTAFEEASISPRAGTPARSTARKANALIARPSGSSDRGHRDRGYDGAAEQPFQLLWDRG